MFKSASIVECETAYPNTVCVSLEVRAIFKGDTTVAEIADFQQRCQDAVWQTRAHGVSSSQLPNLGVSMEYGALCLKGGTDWNATPEGAVKLTTELTRKLSELGCDVVCSKV